MKFNFNLFNLVEWILFSFAKLSEIAKNSRKTRKLEIYCGAASVFALLLYYYLEGFVNLKLYFFAVFGNPAKVYIIYLITMRVRENILFLINFGKLA